MFADAKVKHTQLRGLAKVTMQVTLTFACMNLKKLAKWKRRLSLSDAFFIILQSFFSNFPIRIRKSVHAAAYAPVWTLFVYSLSARRLAGGLLRRGHIRGHIIVSKIRPAITLN